VSYKTHRGLSDYTPYSFLLIILKPKPKLRGRHTLRVILSLPLPSIAGTPCYSFSKIKRYQAYMVFVLISRKVEKLFVKALTTESGK